MNPAPCPGCGAMLPPTELPLDRYFHASPACWAAYTEVLGREYADAVLFGRAHQTTVDAYAVQHAGGPQPDKSVDVHLVGLHLVLERGVAQQLVPRHLQLLVARVDAWPHYPPPANRGATTVADVLAAATPDSHAAAARRWAEDVWRAWAPHHEAVRELASLALPADG